MTSNAWFDQAATVDVLATIKWLQTNGFTEVRRAGGSDTSFGNVAVTYASADMEIVIARDRGQWELHFRLLQSGEVYGLGLVSDVRRGVDWPYRPDSTSPKQLPAGVLWESELPRCLSWLHARKDARTLLIAESERRAGTLRQRNRGK